jgi:hypothetical protein
MTDAGITDFIITLLVLLGVFFMGYMSWRQQGILDTVNEIKQSFQDKAEEVKDGFTGVYR